MRRKDREVTDLGETIDILQRADTIRVGIHSEPYPYVVPLSYGFETVDAKIILYFHGATEGFKHDLLRANPNVCAETDIFRRYTSIGDSITTEYESFIGFGRAVLVHGEEAIKGMDLLLTHCGYENFPYDKSALDYVSIYKIELASYRAKRNLK